MKKKTPILNSQFGNIKNSLNASGQKNIFTGLKNSNTNLKRFDKNQIKINKRKLLGQLPLKYKKNKLLESGLKTNSDFLTEASSVTYRKNLKTIKGHNKFAVPHGEMMDSVNKKTPKKYKKVDTWIDTMPQIKKNQGLHYLRKEDTMRRRIIEKTAEIQAKKALKNKE